MRIPSQLIVMDVVGSLLTVVGVAGMFTDLSHLVPAFADRNVAGMVAGAGLVLLAVSAGKIVGLVRRRRTQPTADDGR